MIGAAVAVAVWLLVGAVVATLSIPWRDVQFHARWCPMRPDERGAPVSRFAGPAFFALAAVLWPFTMRWHRLGFFRGTDAPTQGEAAPQPPPPVAAAGPRFEVLDVERIARDLVEERARRT